MRHATAATMLLILLLQPEPAQWWVKLAWLCLTSGWAIALLWLSYHTLREWVLVTLFALHLALGDEERAWVC